MLKGHTIWYVIANIIGLIIAMMYGYAFRDVNGVCSIYTIVGFFVSAFMLIIANIVIMIKTKFKDMITKLILVCCGTFLYYGRVLIGLPYGFIIFKFM